MGAAASSEPSEKLPVATVASESQVSFELPPVIRSMWKVVRSAIAGAVPESCHCMIKVPASMEAPAEGDVNWTSAETSVVARKMETSAYRHILGDCASAVQSSPGVVLLSKLLRIDVP